MKQLFNNEIINKEIDWFSSYSKTPINEGVTRLLYDPMWRKIQADLKTKLENKGFDVKYDAIGNMMAQIKGTECSDCVIATGSHIDTVQNGGRLDGQFGIIAGYLAVEYLYKTYGPPKKTLEVIVFAEEEGSRFPHAFWGSKSMFGLVKKEDVIGSKDKAGNTFEDEMRESGFDFNADDYVARQDIEAFVEVHIEQGVTLEKENLEIGIVNNIVGQKRFTVELFGESNHAGTTKMSYRKDTIHAFSKIALMCFDEANRLGDPLVVTMGQVIPSPNTVNVVPGETKFTIDMRHTSEKALNEFEAFTLKTIDKVAKEFDMEVKVDKWMDELPVEMGDSVIQVLKESAEEMGLSYKIMHSGAGHDSQIVAPFVDTAMIFTPSIRGISHNPLEETNIDDLNHAVSLLANALYKLAY